MLDTDDESLLRRYNEAADHYFRVLDRPEALFDKPYVPLAEAPFTLGRLAAMIRHLQPGWNDVVLDFGAGMCWLSGVLMKIGCLPVALDVSETALRLGEEALQRVPADQHRPPLASTLFNGRDVDLPDESIDRVACFDALHHVPNKTRVLTEMFRVLREGGRVCLVEPGPGHATSEESLRESERFGVLEDEVDPLETCDRARRIGFSQAYLVPLVEPGSVEWPHARSRGEGGGFDSTASFSVREVAIVMAKGASRPDSRNPARLSTATTIVSWPQVVDTGAEFAARVRVKNTGDTIWLALPQRAGTLGPRHWERALPNLRRRLDDLNYSKAFLRKRIRVGKPVDVRGILTYRRYIERNLLQGLVTVGAHLYSGRDGRVVDRDYARGFLERDVPPGGEAEVTVRMVAPRTPGLYRVAFDPVVEYVSWFEDAGSEAPSDYLRVGSTDLPRDSRTPGRLRCELALGRRVDERHVTVSVTNAGDTIWLAGPLSGPGEVQLGLQALDDEGRVIDRDRRRVRLSRSLWPGEVVRVTIDLGPEVEAGIGGVRLDMVAEGVAWFESQGSHPLTLSVAEGP